jgi:hypothetical protein
MALCMCCYSVSALLYGVDGSSDGVGGGVWFGVHHCVIGFVLMFVLSFSAAFYCWECGILGCLSSELSFLGTFISP